MKELLLDAIKGGLVGLLVGSGVGLLIGILSQSGLQ